MGGKRNRTAGHNYERQICQELRYLGFEARSSREVDPTLDHAGIDIKTSFPLTPQVKCTSTVPNIKEILDKAGILFWKRTKKAGTRFMPSGEYIVMKKEDFYKKFL